MSATWEPNPHSTDDWQVEELVDDAGMHIARIEDMGYACYASAFNVATGNWERNGASKDRVESMLWAERVAGVHPTKPGDDRPPFYYSASSA